MCLSGGPDGVSLMAELDDVRGLFHPKQFQICESTILQLKVAGWFASPHSFAVISYCLPLSRWCADHSKWALGGLTSSVEWKRLFRELMTPQVLEDSHTQ